MDFSAYNTHFIDWVLHEKNESIASYAKKLTQQITHEKPIVIGLSFGEMMAIEIGKIIETSNDKSFRIEIKIGNRFFACIFTL